jgi:hypothetical protein
MVADGCRWLQMVADGCGWLQLALFKPHATNRWQGRAAGETVLKFSSDTFLSVLKACWNRTATRPDTAKHA